MTDGRTKVLLTGSKGMLAQAVAFKAPFEYVIHGVDLPEFDMTDCSQVESAFARVQPDVVINCAAYTNVDGCETEQALAYEVNGIAVGYLADAAKKVDAVLVHISTDYVFDGAKKSPYKEDDQTNPQSAYGSSKLLGEQQILSSGLEKFYILRTSWLFGPGGNNFVATILRLAADKEELRIVADQVGSPTYTHDLAKAIFSLLSHANPHSTAPSPYGIYHFSNLGQCSWYGFAEEIISVAKMAGVTLKVKDIVPIKTEEYPLPAKRPSFSVFDKTKYLLATTSDIPRWQESLKDYFQVGNIS